MKKVNRVPQRKLMIGGLLLSIFLLGACQKSDTTSKSTKQTESIMKTASSKSSVSSSSLESTSATNTSSMTQQSTSTTSDDQSDTISTAREQLIGKQFSIEPSLYDGEDADQAMKDNKAPQSLMHDGWAGVSFTNDMLVHIKLAGTYRPDHDAPYALTKDTLVIKHNTIPYTIKNGLISFGTWTTTTSDGHTITWTFSPDKNTTGSATSASADTSVDTKNLTSSQLKEWVGAVLDKQFSLGRTSFPYKLTVENKDGYAYVRVNHQTQQVDTIEMFRINGEGQLEEGNLSHGYPATYEVVSSKFMDTSTVKVMNSGSAASSSVDEPDKTDDSSGGFW